ncbi:transmembrane protein 186 [Osmerus mordax]|uniref:transmembrane protein 186 n=1 Tax=Osmerus mordax TaxID=8014 RepID=UPI00350F1931
MSITSLFSCFHRTTAVMHRSTLLLRLTHQALAHRRGLCLVRRSSTRLVLNTQPHAPNLPCGGRNAPFLHHRPQGLSSPSAHVLLAKCSDLSSQNYTLIYSLPHIMLLRAVSRLKLLQTGITVVLLPPVYYMYLQGDASDLLVVYSTGIALFAGTMLYTASHFFRRVVGMMYVDSAQTTLRVSHLTFWGKRTDVYMPVSDVMTVGDAGDSIGEPILKLKRYSCADTLYFSTRLGRVVDRHTFEKVFGTLT